MSCANDLSAFMCAVKVTAVEAVQLETFQTLGNFLKLFLASIGQANVKMAVEADLAGVGSFSVTEQEDAAGWGSIHTHWQTQLIKKKTGPKACL